MTYNNNRAKRTLDELKSTISWKYSDNGLLFNLARVQFALGLRPEAGRRTTWGGFLGIEKRFFEETKYRSELEDYYDQIRYIYL